MTCGIYKITNKVNNKKYIGKSIHIEQRWKEHLKGKGSKDLYKDILYYGKENFIFEILEVCKEDLLNQKEEYWIKYYDSFHQGYNKNQGGDNVEHATCKTQKQIFCYDLEGNFVASYKSLSEAEKETKIPNSNISKAARGEGRKRAGNYLWSYNKVNSMPKYTRGNGSSKRDFSYLQKKVYQFDKNNVLLNSFSSIKEASDKTNTNYNSIGMVCNGKRKIAGGFIWSFNKEGKNGS